MLNRLFSYIIINFITDLPLNIKELGTLPFNVILVVVNRFTKVTHYTMTQKSITSAKFTKLLLKDVIRLHKVPEQIVSD